MQLRWTKSINFDDRYEENILFSNLCEFAFIKIILRKRWRQPNHHNVPILYSNSVDELKKSTYLFDAVIQLVWWINSVCLGNTISPPTERIKWHSSYISHYGTLGKNHKNQQDIDTQCQPERIFIAYSHILKELATNSTNR